MTEHTGECGHHRWCRCAAGPAQPAGRPGHGTAQPRLAARAYGGRRDKRMGPAGSSAGQNGPGARAWPESLGQPGLAAAARHGRGGHHRGRVRRLRPGAAGGAGQPPPGYGWPDRTLRPTHKTETLGQFSSLRCFRSLRAFRAVYASLAGFSGRGCARCRPRWRCQRSAITSPTGGDRPPAGGRLVARVDWGSNPSRSPPSASRSTRRPAAYRSPASARAARRADPTCRSCRRLLHALGERCSRYITGNRLRPLTVQAVNLDTP